MSAVVAVADPEWRQKGSCRHFDPDTWHPLGTGVAAADDARDVCRRCPVQHDCASEAIRRGETSGVWGGYHLDRSVELNALHRDYPNAQRNTAREPQPGSVQTLTCKDCGKRFTHPNLRTRCRACELGRVPAAPAQAHIKRLRSLEATNQQIADAAGLPVHTIKQILYGQLVNTTPDKVAAVLSVTGIEAAVPG